MTEQKKPLVLLILDGFGYSDDEKHNAIKNADAPVWQSLWNNNPKTLIHTSGMAVGLPEGQMGNSEVGHMTLGAGRVVYQNFTRINKAIADGDFFNSVCLGHRKSARLYIRVDIRKKPILVLWSSCPMEANDRRLLFLHLAKTKA